MNRLKELSPSQREAVTHIKGPMLVLAGPGSGKTRVITERVDYLINSGVKPEHILVVTFTRAAAHEMKWRFLNGTASEKKKTGLHKVHFGTFHSIFFTILKVHYGYTTDNILKENEKFALLKEFISGVQDFEIRDENEFVKDVSSQISFVKSSKIDIDDFYSLGCPEKLFKQIYNKYSKWIRDHKKIDFDDMLIFTYELFDARKDLLKKWQSYFRYILVDEFQDVNMLQYNILKQLTGKEKNVFIVGDDDQSIYGFRGARPDIMQLFLEEFPDAKKVLLGTNYRCTPNIVDASAKVIGFNENRMKKTLSSNLEEKIKGLSDEEAYEKINPYIEIQEFENLKEESDKILYDIMSYREAGLNYGDISILFRTNALARTVVSKLSSHNIPFFMKDNVPNIYEHWIVKDILSYIKIALGSSDRNHYLRVYNRPNRYINRNVFSSPEVDINEIYDFYEEKEWMLERLDKFVKDMKYLSSLKPYAGVNFIRRGIGYDGYIKDYAEKINIKPDDMMGLMDELLALAKEFDSYKEWFDFIDEYTLQLEEQKAARNKSMRENKEEAVIIQTMHSSKGLEYRCVIIPDANEGIIPHNKAVLEEDIEEERRLFYVSMTRAKQYLHIYFTKTRFNKDAVISRFAEELMS